jgi:hypothetical protein
MKLAGGAASGSVTIHDNPSQCNELLPLSQYPARCENPLLGAF